MRKFGLLVFIVGCTNHHAFTTYANDASTSSPPPVITIPDAGADDADVSDSCQSNCSSQNPSSSDGIKNGSETDIDCGGTNAPPCNLNKICLVNSDCLSQVCNYNNKCIEAPSCVNHYGGDTCGLGENEDATAIHESCCKSLPVIGFTDPNHPTNTVYLDKYEITAGRVRAWINALTQEMGGNPDVKNWVATHRPEIWNDTWTQFLPSDYEGGMITINRLLLGDPRHDGQTQAEAGPGVVLPPPTDQTVSLGLNHQFGAQVYADLHGNNCGVFPGSYGLPIFYYTPDILVANGEVPRVDPLGYNGQTLSAQNELDTKAMNCITNAMLVAFCAWDGGQLATADVMDYITATPNATDDVSSCGTQYDNHDELLGNIFTHTVQTGGRCANVNLINATFDAGDNLPVPGSSLNIHNYHYPDLGNSTSDKSWEIAAPGRLEVDAIRINSGDEPWMDIAGNLNESVFNLETGRFGVRFRGLGFGTERSTLNTDLMPGETILRVQRPEVKSALVGGRCMRFR